MIHTRKSSRACSLMSVGVVALTLLGCGQEPARPLSPGKIGNTESKTNEDNNATELPIAGGGGKEWTFAIYLASETDDDLGAMDDVDAMERLYPQLSPFMDIVALADGWIDSERGWTSRTRLLQIRADDSDHIVSEVAVPEDTELARLLKANENELLMSSPAVLNAFLDLVNTYYPSRHLALDVVDHGAAWHGAVYDYDDDFKMVGPLTTSQFSSAFAASTRPIDVLGFDACVMQNFATNTWWQLSRNVKYVVASEQNQVAAGWTMGNVVGRFSERHARDGQLAPQSLAAGIVEAFNQSDEHNSTISALELGNWPAVVTALDDLGRALVAAGGISNPALSSIVNDGVARTYGDNTNNGLTEEDLVDITTFCALLENTFESGSAINAAAAELRLAVADTILVNQTVDAVSHGVTLYLPKTSMPSDKSIAENESLSAGTLALTPNWRAFLESYPPTGSATGG